MELITISTQFGPAEAQLIRSRLEAAGFHVMITSELAAMYSSTPFGSGGIRVQVPEDEAAEAREFLEKSTE